MSTSASTTAIDRVAIKPEKLSWRNSQRVARILRLAVGATLAMAIAQAINWPLSYVTPALVVAMLTMSFPPLTYRETLRNIIYTICAFPVGMALTLFFLPFPVVFIGAYGLIYFFTHYYLHKGAPFFLILMLIISTTILPLVGNADEGLSRFLAFSIFFGACLGAVILQLAHGLFPDPPGSEKTAPAPFQTGYSPQAAKISLQTTIVILPAMIAFLCFDWQVHVVAMLYVGLVGLEGGVGHSKKEARQYILANLAGGVVAIAFYCLIVAVPEFHFFVALMFFTTLVIGEQAFSNRLNARYFPTALIGLVIMISSSTGAGSEVSVVYLKRVLYIVLASIYVVSASLVLERYVFRSHTGGH